MAVFLPKCLTRTSSALGLGFGSLFFDRSRHTERGPWEWQRVEDGLGDKWTYGRSSTTTKRSLQLRHVELVTRLQLHWGPVRPYLEGFVGLGILWNGVKLNGELSEKTRSAALLYGGTLGVDLQLFPCSGRNKHVVIVTLAVKRQRTGALTLTTRADSNAVNSNESVKHTARDSLSLWTPLLAVGLAF